MLQDNSERPRYYDCSARFPGSNCIMNCVLTIARASCAALAADLRARARKNRRSAGPAHYDAAKPGSLEDGAAWRSL